MRFLVYVFSKKKNEYIDENSAKELWPLMLMQTTKFCCEIEDM